MGRTTKSRSKTSTIGRRNYYCPFNQAIIGDMRMKAGRVRRPPLLSGFLGFASKMCLEVMATNAFVPLSHRLVIETQQ